MDRRSSLDDQDDMAPSSARGQVDVFDDEFEVEEFDGVADGFRPGQSHDREGGVDGAEDDDEEEDGTSAQYGTHSASQGPSRSSTRKSRSSDNPFASPEDEERMPLQRTPSGNFTVMRNSVDSSSSSRYAGQGSTRFGAAGPSHPYSIYPQGTMARTPSVATQSTSRPSRQSTQRYAPGPQHPYALYPQGVGDDDVDDDGEGIAHNPVPVGFMGLGSSFQRRRGPDGEEQDILGDYGHAEQLPPYSRYPEDGPEKAPLLDVPSPPGPLHSRAPVFGTDPGMSLMHEPLLPVVQQYMTDESNLQRQNSRLSRMSRDPESRNDDHSGRSLLTDKSWTEKSWSEKRKTKICGVPFWWFLAFAAVVVFIGAVVGGGLGGFAAGQQSGVKIAQKGASSTLYDASIITTATGVPPATGTYPLSLGLPQETQSACLTNSGDQAAWNCDLAGDAEVWISIESAPTANGHVMGAYLFTVAGSDNASAQLSYGTQIANLNTSFAPFIYVTDLDDPGDGNAFYFQDEYNKLVVVPPGAMDVTARRIKRDSYTVPDWLVEKQYATPGDKPWFCYWNQTLLEAFIYKSQPAVIAPTPTSSSSSSTITPAPKSSTSSKTSTTSNTSTRTSSTPTTTNPWSITWANPSEYITTTITMPTTSCTYSGYASAFPSWMSQYYPEYYQSGSPTNQNAKRHNPLPSAYVDRSAANTAAPFEYLVKIEERRLPQSPAPMCVQYMVLDNYEWNVVTNSNGEQVTITLAESDPPEAAYNIQGSSSRRVVRRSRGKRDTTPKGGCHCQWMSGQ